MNHCVFCKIIDGTYIADDFRQMGLGIVSFIPLNPVTPGHRLFVPTEHSINAGEGPMCAASAFEEACDWGDAGGEDFNIITSAGKNATQTIFHTHIHYVPRRPDDGLMLPWTQPKRIGDSAWRSS